MKLATKTTRKARNLREGIMLARKLDHYQEQARPTGQLDQSAYRQAQLQAEAFQRRVNDYIWRSGNEIIRDAFQRERQAIQNRRFAAMDAEDNARAAERRDLTQRIAELGQSRESF